MDDRKCSYCFGVATLEVNREPVCAAHVDRAQAVTEKAKAPPAADPADEPVAATEIKKPASKPRKTK